MKFHSSAAALLAAVVFAPTANAGPTNCWLDDLDADPIASAGECHHTTYTNGKGHKTQRLVMHNGAGDTLTFDMQFWYKKGNPNKGVVTMALNGENAGKYSYYWDKKNDVVVEFDEYILAFTPYQGDANLSKSMSDDHTSTPTQTSTYGF